MLKLVVQDSGCGWESMGIGGDGLANRTKRKEGRRRKSGTLA